MRCMVTRIITVAAVGVLLAGAIVAAFPTESFAAPPGRCPCAKTITTSDGRVCKLISCGSDCVYLCPY